ncbi:TonB-dependent receptor [Palleniella muris]|uniref:TonB-dependent receptor n=1 Tax=Palleniella muris TaxID=3038145 RepID=A0AC61QLR5_9BACT|nr:TonB-dependent receptor [Palleniella muris]TGX79906.1 TonB-dependent receptor [Palleniella muris]
MKKKIFLALPCVALSLNVVAWREASAATRVFNNYAVSRERLDTETDSARWSKELGEVVVTGQGGAIQKRRLSTNVFTIKAHDIGKANNDRLDMMLQAVVPNMQINLSNGQPGAASMVRSRGLSSVQINATPVIYVDGVRIDNSNTATGLSQKLNEQGIRAASASGSLSDIPMENIERVEYVNGGAATTLYGSDAANGVIQIFTKKGGEGKLNAMVEAQIGWEEANGQFYHFRRTKDLLNQTGLMQRYRVALDGGGKSGGWSFGASASANDGIIVADNNKSHKYDARFGSHLDIMDNLTYSNSLGFVHNDYMRSRNGNEGYYSGLWLTECGAASSMSYVGENGENVPFLSDIDAMDATAYRKFKDFIFTSEKLQDKRADINRFQMSHELTYKPMRNLVVKGIFGLDYRYEGVKNIITNELIEAVQYNGPIAVGNISAYERKFTSTTFELNAQHKYYHEDLFSVVSSAGFQCFGNHDRQAYEQAVGVEDGVKAVDDSNRTYEERDRSTLYNYGAYLQENIGFRDKYYLDLGLRADFNTGFGENVGWQWYPKMGLSYMLSSEKFMEPLAASGILGSLRFYANYGVAGNYPPAFAYQKTVQFGQYLDGITAEYGQYGNPDLRPEKKHSFEAGFNSEWANGYFRLGVAYYNAVTHDALFSVHSAPSSGQSSTYLANIGKIRNRGFEFIVASDFLQTKDLKARFQASLNTLDNKVLSTGGETAFGVGTFANEALMQNIVEEGKPIGFLRGNKVVCNADGSYSHTEALSDLGSTLPDVYGSLALNVDYKGFSFFANADYQIGGHVYELDRHFRWRYGATDACVNEDWLPEGSAHKDVWTNFTSCFVEKADYLKVRTIGMTYKFRLKNISKSITLGFTCHNPFSFTKAEVDPEACLSDAASYGGASVAGIVYGSYTSPRQFVGSVKVNF